MPLFQPSDDMSADKLISDFKSLDKLEEQLKFVLLHLYSLTKEEQDRFRPQIVEYEKLLSNTKFMRKVKYRDSLILDYPTEYFGNDYGEEDPFMYDEELENQIIKIGMRLLATVGLIAKSMKERSVSIGDET